MKWFLMNRGQEAKKIYEKTGWHPLLCLLLANRDIAENDWNSYFHPSIEALPDPFLFQQMEGVVSYLSDCLQGGIPIRVVGDYDQDGVAATTILVKGLRYFAKKLGVDPFHAVSYAIPDRMADGYGLNCRLVDQALEEGCGLIITCDNGIAAFEALEYAGQQGIPVIVTDHHQMVKEGDVEKLPPCELFLNPHAEGSGYPFADLCGAGVAFKVISALAMYFRDSEAPLLDLLQFAALGTICDVVPLTGENRMIVSLGLRELNRTQNPGLQALLEVNHWDREVTVYTAGFVIGPCINASGRLFTANLGVELFLEENPETLQEYGRELYRLNEERKAMTRQGVEDAENAITAWEKLPPLLMLYLPEVHESICGLIAGRLKQHYFRPSLVFTDAAQEGDESERPALIKGSGRSIPAYNMFQKLNVHREEYESFGGHAMACGMTLAKEKFEPIRQQLVEEAKLNAEDLMPTLTIDAKVSLPQIDRAVMKLVEGLAPYGQSNPKPLFAALGCNLLSARLVGANRTVLQMMVEQNGARYQAVYFGWDQKQGEWEDRGEEELLSRFFSPDGGGIKLDLAYFPEWNEFRGNRRIQLKLEDFRPSPSL